MIKGNKGEWSEFYTFLKILVDKKLFAADSNLEIIKEKYYSVLKIIREEPKTGKKIYDLTRHEEEVLILNAEGIKVGVVNLSDLKKKIKEIFNEIKTGRSRGTFSVPLTDNFIHELNCSRIKAGNNRKADLTLVIHDRISPTFPELGFSVKSQIGSPSTLLNASGVTNFIFKVGDKVGDFSAINEIKGSSKVRDRVKGIEYGLGNIVYYDIESEQFKKNLKKIDTFFPEMLAEIVKAFYQGKGRTLVELVENMDENQDLKKKYGIDRDAYVYKLKNFLVAVALGMTPKKEWDGSTEAHGGYIVVREDGEIVCYHLYNRDEFQEYLYRNTKLETPSTTRHKFGDVYEKDGQNFLKLNLQIRFIK